MKVINWCGREWTTQQDWAAIDIRSPYQYNGDDAVNIDNNNRLHLLAHHNPHTFDIDGQKITSNLEVGLIMSKEYFQYGHFEIEAMLPDGDSTWCAYWLYGTAWPPEIDIFEAWTNKRKWYFDFTWKSPFRLWHVNPNFHFGTSSANHTEAGTQGGFFGFKSPKKHFLKYEMIWTPDRVEIKYNGHTVQVFDDARVAEMRVPMRILIDNGTTDKADYNNPNYFNDFQVNYFKYTPL